MLDGRRTDWTSVEMFFGSKIYPAADVNVKHIWVAASCVVDKLLTIRAIFFWLHKYVLAENIIIKCQFIFIYIVCKQNIKI